MTRDDPVITRIYHRLPDRVKSSTNSLLSGSIAFLAFKFLYGQDNFLREKGWFASEKRGYPVTPDGDPLPWYTYSAIDFLDDRVGESLDVFEYGSGYGTQWWAERVNSVRSVEHDRKWAERIGPDLPASCQVTHRPVDDGYISAVDEHAPVDVVIIDGMERGACLEPAIDALASDGVVIWDDFHRYEWEDTVFSPLRAAEFNRIPFHGLKSLNAHYRCTAVFYRQNNCLGI